MIRGKPPLSNFFGLTSVKSKHFSRKCMIIYEKSSDLTNYPRQKNLRIFYYRLIPRNFSPALYVRPNLRKTARINLSGSSRTYYERGGAYIYKAAAATLRKCRRASYFFCGLKTLKILPQRVAL